MRVLSTTEIRREESRRYAIGVAFVLSSSIVASTIGPLIRLMESAVGWQIVFYRSVSMAAALAIYFGLRNGSAAFGILRRVTWRAFAGGICMGGATSMGTWAFLHTKVANVLFITGGAPFITGVLAWLLLGERLRRGTWLAIAFSFVGIAIMAGSGLAEGQYLGDALALGATISYALLVVVLRSERETHDPVPLLLIGTLIATFVAATLADTLRVDLYDLVLCVVLGAGTSFVAYLLITMGARSVPAGELTLLASIEMVLGPTWVWLIVGEVPGGTTFLGGACVMAAIVAQGVMSLRTARR